MSKIQKIKISNFKSIEDFEAEFKGCTAIITGGNNKGKTSFLKGIPDRIRFIRPDVMVKKGAKEGRGEMTLTTGEKFIWDFDDEGKDKLILITDEARQSVSKELGKQFFPPVFDIDKFLQSSPKEQVKQLQAIVGIDFTEIDERYRKAYDTRTERNREAEIYHVKLEKMIKVPFVAPVDLSELIGKKDAEKQRLNSIYLEIKAVNQKLRDVFNKERESIQKKTDSLNECMGALGVLQKHGYSGDALQFVSDLRKDIPELKEPNYIEEMPDRSSLDAIDAQIITASETNSEAKKYEEYINHKKATESAKGAAEDSDQLVKNIESERKKMIESAKFPEGISITPSGIEVDNLPLDKTQISTSKLYCAALRIASMNLGEVKTLYFDASFLDRNTLSEIQTWADSQDLQLLIERPDFDGGEIKYEIIEHHG